MARVAHNRSNFIGRRFGRLVVIDYASTQATSGGNKILSYLCRCDCGHLKEVRRCNLGRSTKSCGCLKRENMPAPPPSDLEPGDAALHTLLRRYKRDARKRSRVFDLTQEEFRQITSEPCHYCGAEPATVIKTSGNGAYTYNGLDRLDNGKGYEWSNVVPCCSHCNYAKRGLSYREFCDWVEAVHTRIKGNNGLQSTGMPSVGSPTDPGRG